MPLRTRILLVPLAIVFFWSGLQAVRFIQDRWFLPTYETRWGQVILAQEVQAISLAEQVVHRSPVTGTVTFLVRQGQRVAKGAVLAEVIPDRPRHAPPDLAHWDQRKAEVEKERKAIQAELDQAVDAWRQGVLTGQGVRELEGQIEKLRESMLRVGERLEGIDLARSAEEKIILDSLQQQTPQVIRAEKAGVVGLLAAGRVMAQEEICVVLDNYEITLEVRLDPKETRWYREGDRVDLEVTEGIYPAHVVGVGEAMQLKLTRFPSSWLEKNQFPVRVVRGRYEGVLVPTKSLAQKDAKTGVWLENRQFQEVQVRGGDQEWSVVVGVSPGVKILTRPVR